MSFNTGISPGGASSPTRFCSWSMPAGGEYRPYYNIMDYVNDFKQHGDAVDFGDLVTVNGHTVGWVEVSNGHMEGCKNRSIVLY